MKRGYANEGRRWSCRISFFLVLSDSTIGASRSNSTLKIAPRSCPKGGRISTIGRHFFFSVNKNPPNLRNHRFLHFLFLAARKSINGIYFAHAHCPQFFFLPKTCIVYLDMLRKRARTFSLEKISRYTRTIDIVFFVLDALQRSFARVISLLRRFSAFGY